jgi:acetylornithine deacetylase/succinyl-diaminopimelate desuccinylase-like protein
MADPLLDDLLDWLRIPSISTGGGDPAELERAAAWVVEKVRAAGGEGEVVATAGNPLAVGELRAAREDAPTVLIYGHYDVQSTGEDDAWTTPPFAPEIRDGRIWARGASDDKGNFLPLLHVACEMAREGTLPVHVRVLVEGEEEVGGSAVSEWLRADERGADAAIVFDSGMADPGTPAITVGLRGLVMVHFTVRTGRRDLHSGMYGGSVLNAVHVATRMLANVLPGPDGRPREELRAGIAPVADAERASWEKLKPGDEVIAEVGGRPVHAGAGNEYYERNGADASVEVNELVGGEPRTMIPSAAKVTVSVRLAPGQSPREIRPVLEALLTADVPDGAEVIWEGGHDADPALFPVDSPVIQIGGRAIASATGMEVAYLRSGGSIPIVAEFANRGIPAIVSGFALPDDDIHAPNESFRLESLELGAAAARELYVALAELRS